MFRYDIREGGQDVGPITALLKTDSVPALDVQTPTWAKVLVATGACR